MSTDDQLVCPACKSTSFVKNGKCRVGRQRYRCKQCPKRFTRERLDIRLEPKTESAIRNLLSQGWSTRKIAKELGVSKNTVLSRRTITRQLHEPVISESEKACHYCGAEVTARKGCDRKTPRSKHRFCDSECYQAFVVVNDESRMASALMKLGKNNKWNEKTS